MSRAGEVCEFTLVPKLTCGHCLGSGDVIMNEVRVGPTFKARFDGWCRGCESEIVEGDLLMYVDDVVVHAACTEEFA